MEYKPSAKNENVNVTLYFIIKHKVKEYTTLLYQLELIPQLEYITVYFEN